MKISPKSTILLTSLSALIPLHADILTGEGFSMADQPVSHNITDDFAARVPAANLRVITDLVGDVTDPSDLNPPAPGTFVNAWDVSTVSVAFDRVDNTLWFGLELSGNDRATNDFGTPTAQGGFADAPDFGPQEYVAGSIGIGNSVATATGFDIWTGVPTQGDGSGFATAPYEGNNIGSVRTDYDFSGFPNALTGAPNAPLGLEGNNPWITPDTVYDSNNPNATGGNSYGFMIDLDANPLTAGMLPDSSVENTVFTFQFDLGTINDNYGEEQIRGTVIFAPTAIPEPTSAPLLALLLGLSFTTRRKR